MEEFPEKKKAGILLKKSEKNSTATRIKLVLSEEARRDLKGIQDYISDEQESPIAAVKVIEKILDTRIRNISGGELRYLEIKLLINMETKYLLLDEPFNRVSPILIEDIKRLILESSPGKGIILTDHAYRDVLSIATRIYIMQNGSIKEIADKSELAHFGYVPDETENSP